MLQKWMDLQIKLKQEITMNDISKQLTSLNILNYL